MFQKDLAYIILPLFLLYVTQCSIPYNVVPTKAQQASTNFLTYTNRDLGFTMKYPSDWTVNNTRVTNDHTVRFTSADRVGHLFVTIRNATPAEMIIATMNDDSEKANAVRESLNSNANLLELDTSRYFLSGHAAIRLVETSSQPDLKAMEYNTLLNGKRNKVTYFVSPFEDFPRDMRAAQSMIDSFQIMSKQ